MRQNPDPATQLDETSAHPTNRRIAVLAEIGNRLMVGREPPGSAT